MPFLNLKLAHMQKSLDGEMMNDGTICVPSVPRIPKNSIPWDTVSNKAWRSSACVIQDDFLESSGSAVDEVGSPGVELVAAGGKDVGGPRPRERILCGLLPQF